MVLGLSESDGEKFPSMPRKLTDKDEKLPSQYVNSWIKYTKLENDSVFHQGRSPALKTAAI